MHWVIRRPYLKTNPSGLLQSDRKQSTRLHLPHLSQKKRLLPVLGLHQRLSSPVRARFALVGRLRSLGLRRSLGQLLSPHPHRALFHPTPSPVHQRIVVHQRLILLSNGRDSLYSAATDRSTAPVPARRATPPQRLAQSYQLQPHSRFLSWLTTQKRVLLRRRWRLVKKQAALCRNIWSRVIILQQRLVKRLSTKRFPRQMR